MLSCVVTSVCFLLQTYSQLAHPIQQARALGLLFQSKVLDIDNIDVSDSHHTSHFLLYALCLHFSSLIPSLCSAFSLIMMFRYIYMQESRYHLLFPGLFNKVSVESCSNSYVMCVLLISFVCTLQLAMGKMMDQGPVLIITFQAQVVMVIRSPKGDIVEGDPVSKLMIVGNLI